MRRRDVVPLLRALTAAASVLMVAVVAAHAAPCPTGGASMEVVLQTPDNEPVTALVFGNLRTPTCDDDTVDLAVDYGELLTCQPDTPSSCRTEQTGLHPGDWTHQIVVTEGAAVGQWQGRKLLLLDHRAGIHSLPWPIFRSVHTVTSLEDAAECVGCLRAALAEATLDPKPALIQFATDLTGTILLAGALPPLSGGQTTIDGFTVDGVPRLRTIDANGLAAPALRITSEGNQVFGLRLVNVGGNVDTVIVEGAAANDNLLDSLDVVGRASQPCGVGGIGCVIDGVCREPSPQEPLGVCGDDGIALRFSSGTGVPNRVRGCLVSAAHDKGIKVSDGGVATVERSLIIGNVDGGLQATLGGSLVARENIALANRGNNSANGLAVNGPAVDSSVPGRLDTRGNLSIDNSLRGISVRNLSLATLHDDFACGNGTVGVAVLEAGGFGAIASATGLGVVHNGTGGVVVGQGSIASFAPGGAPGENAFAFNGPLLPPRLTNFQSASLLPIAASGNGWEHCGPCDSCDVGAVLALDVSFTSLQAPVEIAPALPTRQRAAPRIDAIVPSFAAAGDFVRIYGSGFDAIEGAGTSCASIPAANTCRPLRGNCVLIDRQPAEVVAVTPTMLVVRAPFTCVEPVSVRMRTRWSRASAGAEFCSLAAVPDTAP
jgi:hypothetical protein